MYALVVTDCRSVQTLLDGRQNKSPRQQDSNLLKVRPLTVKRSRLEKRQIKVKDTRDSKIPHLNQEGVWLGKKTGVKPNSNVWGIKCDEDLLNLYGASEW